MNMSVTGCIHSKFFSIYYIPMFILGYSKSKHGVISRMKLENMMNKGTDTNCRISFISNVQNSDIHTNRK